MSFSQWECDISIQINPYIAQKWFISSFPGSTWELCNILLFHWWSACILCPGSSEGIGLCSVLQRPTALCIEEDHRFITCNTCKTLINYSFPINFLEFRRFILQLFQNTVSYWVPLALGWTFLSVNIFSGIQYMHCSGLLHNIGAFLDIPFLIKRASDNYGHESLAQV